MKEIMATVTERGQVTIPAEVRRLLGIKTRGSIVFGIEDGAVRITRPAFSLEEAFGSVSPKQRPEDFDRMIREAMEDRAAAAAEELQGG